MSANTVVTYEGFAVEISESHNYWLRIGEEADYERVRVPGVTSVCGILNKPLLVPWAERMGAEGALRLERAGQLNGLEIPEAVGKMRAAKEGADAKRDVGADRGTAIHDAMGAYCSTGKVPKLLDFDPAHRSYVQGFCSWLIANSPEPEHAEVVIGEPERQYGGRFDLIATVKGERVLYDFKTSENGTVYPECHIQLRGYQKALPACGIEAPERCVAVALNAEGSYREQECLAHPSIFTAVLATYRAMKQLEAQIRQARNGDG